MRRPGALHRAAAEFVGTFGLVFAGCGAVVIDATTGGAVTHVGVALTFGIIIATMIYATGHISGAHCNPAVTLAFAATRHFPLTLVPAYLLAQFAAAVAASAVLRLLFGNVARLGSTLPSGGAGQSLAMEALLTFFLVFVIIAVATDYRRVRDEIRARIEGELLVAGA